MIKHKNFCQIIRRAIILLLLYLIYLIEACIYRIFSAHVDKTIVFLTVISIYIVP